MNIRSKTIRRALDLLAMSRISYLVHNTRAIGFPLENGVAEKVFKTLFLDVGLSNHILKLRPANLESLVLTNEGSLAEQFIGQELLCLPPCFMKKVNFQLLSLPFYLVQEMNRFL